MYKFCENRGIYEFWGNRRMCNMHLWLMGDGRLGVQRPIWRRTVTPYWPSSV